MRAIVGIDPGVTGALALYDPDKSKESGLRWYVIDMPVIGGDRQELNAPSLRDFLVKYDPAHAFLELAGPMPRDGRVGAFKYGSVYGGIKAVLACCGVPYTVVTSPVWKKHARLKTGSDKHASRLRAIELFPDQSATLARRMDHNRAEAMLIASFGHTRIINEGELL